MLVALSGALIAQNKLLTTKKVVAIIDGDTIVVENQRIRLRGASADYLTKLIKSKKVIITDPIADKWGRVVALVYQNDKLINVECSQTINPDNASCNIKGNIDKPQVEKFCSETEAVFAGYTKSQNCP